MSGKGETLKEKAIMLFYKAFDAGLYAAGLTALSGISEEDSLEDTEMEFIFQAFILPNMEELEANFAANCQSLEISACWEKVRYYLLPTEQENKYFLLDTKEKQVIKVKEENTILQEQMQRFSDYSLVLEKTPEIIDVITLAAKLRQKKRKLYVVAGQEIEPFLQKRAYLEEELENLKVFEDILSFEVYFIQNEEYFPRNVIKWDFSPVNRLEEIRERIHAYRLQTKSNKRPLLSIGIPTAERGTFALSNVIHTLKSQFDYEIEVILSDNNSVTLPEYHTAIKKISDSRFTYNKNEVNLGYHGNVKKLIELARAKYILFNCDTDVLRLERLDDILSIIRDAEQEYSQIITDGERKKIGEQDRYIKMPYEAIINTAFSSNYLFGNIFNVDLIHKHNFIEYLDRNVTHSEFLIAYYHMAIDLFLDSLGNVYVYANSIIEEYKGKTPYLASKKRVFLEIDEFENFEDFTYQYDCELVFHEILDRKHIHGYIIGNEKRINQLRVYTIAGRTAQHISCHHFLKEILYDKGLVAEFIQAYSQLYGKTLFLIKLNIAHNYLNSDVDNLYIWDKIEKMRKYIDIENKKLYHFLKEWKDNPAINEEIENLKEFIGERWDLFREEITLILENR